MTTQWGEIAVSDAHVHFFSHGFFSQLARQKAGLTVESMGEMLGWQMPPREPEALARRWAEELTRQGVARAVLIASLPGDEGSVEAAVRMFPDRFIGYFMVNPCLETARESTEKALAAGLRGICLFPAMHCYSLHDERAGRIVELAAAKPGVIVFVHCGVLTVGVRKKLGLPSLFDMRYSNPIDMHALALRFPNVGFVIPHFGAGYFREALMVTDLCPNVYLDTSSTNAWTRYQPDGIDLEGVFRRALDVAGPGRLLFGTDSSFFPRGWHRAVLERQAAVLAELAIRQEEARAIFGGNLLRLLGLDAA